MCNRNRTEMFRFETANFIVRAVILPDDGLDLSWDDDGETRDMLERGVWEAFGTIVTVSTKAGVTLGENSLWGSIHAKPADFFSDYRASDSMNRNCSIMRAAKGDNVSICHYFPGMIREAIREARKTLAIMPKVRAA